MQRAHDVPPGETRGRETVQQHDADRASIRATKPGGPLSPVSAAGVAGSRRSTPPARARRHGASTTAAAVADANTRRRRRCAVAGIAVRAPASASQRASTRCSSSFSLRTSARSRTGVVSSPWLSIGVTSDLQASIASGVGSCLTLNPSFQRGQPDGLAARNATGFRFGSDILRRHGSARRSAHHAGRRPRGRCALTNGPMFDDYRHALRASVDRLREVVTGLDDAQLHASAYPAEWNVADVLSHDVPRQHFATRAPRTVAIGEAPRARWRLLLPQPRPPTNCPTTAPRR